MYVPKLPLKFIGLWVLNIVLLLAIYFGTRLRDVLATVRINNLANVILGLGALLALLEQGLWDRLHGNNKP